MRMHEIKTLIKEFSCFRFSARWQILDGFVQRLLKEGLINQTFLAAQGCAAKGNARRALPLSGKRKLCFRFSARWQILDGFVQRFLKWRDGRAAEGTPLLRENGVHNSIEGSNPSLSAIKTV